MLLFFALSIPHTLLAKEEKESGNVFRFHTALEPKTVDPAGLNESSGGFLFYNLYRSLYRINSADELIPELASQCIWKTRLKLLCNLKTEIKFSDGTPIVAQDFILAWQRILDPKVGSKHSELLTAISGASEILKGEKPPSALKVIRIQDQSFEIILEKEDPELLYKLASPVLTPIKSPLPMNSENYHLLKTTGPYRIKSWNSKLKIQLENNPFYFDRRNRPPVEIVMVDEDMVALSLYDLHKVNFLRRLAVKEIPLRQKNPDFKFIPLYRFDIIGFGPQLAQQKNLRKALTLSLNFPELTAAYYTPGQIGCPSLPRNMAEPYPCYHFNLAEAQKAFARVPKSLQKKGLKLVFSKLSGEDVARGMEWMQNQWKKNLNFSVELESLEYNHFIQTLQTHPPALFHKGVNLQRPTCTAALELFTSSSKENYIKYNSSTYNRAVSQLSHASGKRKKEICGQTLTTMMNEFIMIPMGEIYSAILAQPQFTGWGLTKLNQLDLTQLQYLNKQN
ncbi:MAG: hypothetical protein K1X29_03180 [Bdellovibrionales bacterium]|nr:hypothetical protein [Bdellovibrionales bacterium]